MIGAERIVHDGQAPWGNFPQDQNGDSKLKICPHQTDTEYADPDERPLRAREPARRHVRPDRVRGVHPGLSHHRLEREVGRPPDRASDGDPLRPPDDPRPLVRRAALRRAAARRGARVRVGRVPVHAVRLELEHERRDHAVPPRVGLLARLATGGARRAHRGLRLDEVRGAHRRAALAHVSDRPAQAGASPRASSPGRSPSSRSSSSTRTRSTRSRPSGTGRSATSSAATRRGRSGTGGSTTPAACPTSTSSSASSRSRSRRRVRGRLRPRRKSPLQLVAFTAVLLAGFEMVQTYWLYTYIPWFYPVRRDRAARAGHGLRQLRVVQAARS